MEIKVSKEDIRLARTNRSLGNPTIRCAVARAFKRAGFGKVEVGFLLAGKPGGKVITLPKRIESFIIRVMDTDKPAPKPTSFTLTKKQVADLRA